MTPSFDIDSEILSLLLPYWNDDEVGMNTLANKFKDLYRRAQDEAYEKAAQIAYGCENCGDGGAKEILALKSTPGGAR